MTKRAEHSIRTNLLFLAIFVICSPTLSAQPARALTATSPTVATPAAPSYEVATIKPHAGGITGFAGIRETLDGLYAVCPLARLVQAAFGNHMGDRVTGGPAWAESTLYDVQAKMSAADTAEMHDLTRTEADARRQLMLQALLKERFKLKVHIEVGQARVFEMVVAKGGTKLEEATPASGGSPNEKPKSTMNFRDGRGVARGESMQGLAFWLSMPNGAVGRTVVDKTGLTGTYNFTLNSSGCNSFPCDPDVVSSMFSALKEIGLKLQDAIAPIQIFVIDHAEPPTEN